MTTVIEGQPIEEEQVPEQTAEDQPEVEPEGEPKAKADKEARYRLRAKDAEAKAQALQARIEAYQKQEVERVVAGTLSDSSDIWVLGLSLDDLLDEEGEVNPEAALEAAEDLVASRPRMGRHQLVTDPTQGQGGGATKAFGWADFLQTT